MGGPPARGPGRPPRRRPWRWSNVPVPEAHLVAGALAACLGRWRPAPLVLPGSRACGCILVLAGAALAGAATRAAGDVDLADPRLLVTTGPYRVTRHPMYVGWTLAYLGGGLVARSAWPARLAPLLVARVVVEARREERALAARFGVAPGPFRSPWTDRHPCTDRSRLRVVNRRG